MPTMSYCRFENTASDLRDCEDELNEMNDPEAELSGSEYKAFVRLIKRCRRLADDYEEII